MLMSDHHSRQQVRDDDAVDRGRRPSIVLLGTGGTIASSASAATLVHDYELTDTIQSVLQAVPQVNFLARVRCEQVMQVESHAISNAELLATARRVEAVLRDPDVDGVVISHGTDTLEETAYFLNLTLKSTKPVVMVGAMRPASALSADGPLNLYNAFLVAACADAAGMGVLVVLNDRIASARDVTKMATTFTDAFGSHGQGNLGQIAGGGVHLFHVPARKHTVATEFTLNEIAGLPQVDILYDYQGAGAHLYQAAVESGAKGIVLAGSGNGSLSPAARAGAELASRAGVLFVRSSRVGQGVVTPLAGDASLGLVAANSLNPQKARVLLMLALGKTRDFRIVQQYFDCC